MWFNDHKPYQYLCGCRFDPWPHSVGQVSTFALSCGVVHRCGSDPALPGLGLWLWLWLQLQFDPNLGTSICHGSGPRKWQKDKKTTTTKKNHLAVRIYISIITLNVKGLNAPTKRHRLPERIQKQDPYICCLKEMQFKLKGTHTN